MYIDESKSRRQTQGIDTWIRSGGHGTLLHVMGFGKTMEGCMASSRLLRKYPDAFIRIVTPSDITRKRWEKELSTFPEINNRVTVQTANEVIESNAKSDCSLMIVDEVHKFISPERIKIIKGNYGHYKYILGLTGTYPSNKDAKELNKYCPVVDIITEEEALRNNWISNFMEFNLALTLPDSDKDRYEQFSIPIAETLLLFKDTHLAPVFRNRGESIFKSSYDVVQSCFSGKKVKISEGKPYSYISASVIREQVAAFRGWSRELDLNTDYGLQRNKFWNPVNIEIRARQFNDVVKKRNDILINHPLKLQAVLDIYDRFPVTTICFNESTNFADDICNAINYRHNINDPDELLSKYENINIAVSYHSNIMSRPVVDSITGQFITYKSGQKAGQPKMFGKDKLKTEIIEGARSGKYKFICTARALDEGLDVANIEQVITTAGTANPIQYAQRSARGKRVDYLNPNKIAKIINIYFDNFIGNDGKLIYSRDKQKLEIRQKNTSSEVRWIESLDDIS